MNIETVTMEPDEAIEQLKLYRAKLKGKNIARANHQMKQEYEAAISALKELRKGHAILDIEEVIKNAPIDAKERPKLAICRANLPQVKFEWSDRNTEAIFIGKTGTRWNAWYSRAKDIAIEINMERQHHFTAIRSHAPEKGPQPETLVGYSLVPLVPPTIELKAKLESHFILWEVENWADTEIGAKPDKDPYLLRRINSTLFAVVAEWDLTEVERLVMKHRL